MTELWLPQIQTSGPSFGVLSNQFGFNVNWTSGQTVYVQAAANVSCTNWCTVATNNMISNSFYFSDAQWTNFPGRFYRLATPLAATTP